MAKSKSGCLPAFLLVAAMFGLLVIIQLATAMNIYMHKFDSRHLDEQPAAAAPLDGSAAASPA